MSPQCFCMVCSSYSMYGQRRNFVSLYRQIKSYHSGSVNLVCNVKINLWKTLFMFINLLFLTSVNMSPQSLCMPTMIIGQLHDDDI